MCNKIVYVGQTGNSIKTRCLDHINDVLRKRNKRVPNHFNRDYHSPSNLKFVLIEKVGIKDKRFREFKETIWMYKLKTLITGLNKNVKRNLWKFLKDSTADERREAMKHL